MINSKIKTYDINYIIGPYNYNCGRECIITKYEHITGKKIKNKKNIFSILNKINNNGNYITINKKTGERIYTSDIIENPPDIEIINNNSIHIIINNDKISEEHKKLIDDIAFYTMFSSINTYINKLRMLIINIYDDIYIDLIFTVSNDSKEINKNAIVVVNNIPYALYYDYNFTISCIYEDINKVESIYYNNKSDYYMMDIKYIPYAYSYCLISYVDFSRKNNKAKTLIFCSWYENIMEGIINLKYFNNNKKLERIYKNNIVFSENTPIYIPSAYIPQNKYKYYFPIYGIEFIDYDKVKLYSEPITKYDMYFSNDESVIMNVVSTSLYGKPIINNVNPFNKNRIINTTLWLKH